MTVPILTSTVTIPNEILFSELENETVLLNLDTGFYYSLNEVGARIWQLLLEHGRVDTTLAVLIDEYDIDAQRLEEDLVALVRQLSENSLLVIDGDKNQKARRDLSAHA